MTPERELSYTVMILSFETDGLGMSIFSFLLHLLDTLLLAKTDLFKFEPPHNRTNKMTMRPAKTQISLGIRPV